MELLCRRDFERYQGKHEDADRHKKIYFDGNIQTFGVRSGENGLNNVYLDFLDENGTHCYIGFMTEGTKGVVFYSGGKLVWKITV